MRYRGYRMRSSLPSLYRTNSKTWEPRQFSAVQLRGRERKGPPSQKLADLECRFPYDSYGRDRAPFRPFLAEDFGAVSGGPLFSEISMKKNPKRRSQSEKAILGATLRIPRQLWQLHSRPKSHQNLILGNSAQILGAFF